MVLSARPPTWGSPVTNRARAPPSPRPLSSSGRGLLHFRAQHHLDRTAAVAEESRREIYRLVHDLTAYQPTNDLTDYSPTFRASVRGSSGARRSSARLDSVLGQLSRLSQSLGESYNQSESLAEEEPETSLHEVEPKPEVDLHTKSLCARPKRGDKKHFHSQSLTTTSAEHHQLPRNLPLKHQRQKNLKIFPTSGPNISLRRQLLLGGLEEEIV